MDENALRTVNIPRYYQMRTITNDKYSDYTKFSALIEDPVKNLKYILSELKKDYQICYDEFDNAERLSDVARDNYRDALSDYETEIARFEDGIQQIEYTDWVKRAFVLMNKTFQTKLDSNTHPIEGWRLFQIVFVVGSDFGTIFLLWKVFFIKNGGCSCWSMHHPLDLSPRVYRRMMPF